MKGGKAHRQEKGTLYKLIVARSDIHAAHEVAAYAQEQVKDLPNQLWLPLQDAVVVRYARPFTANRPFGPLANRWSKFDRPEFQQMHDLLVGLRDQLVAHGDAERRSVAILPPGYKFPGAPTPSDSVAATVSTHRPPPASFETMAELCLDLGGRLHEATQEKLNELYGDIPSGLDPFDLVSGARIELPDEDGFLVLGAEKMPWLASSEDE